jgi:putative FmdB family regulatory protein
MPNYDYRCNECGHAWEQQLTIANRDVPTTEPCPECGKTAVEKYLPSTSGLCYTLEGKKVPDTFKDVLRRMKKQHIRSHINV